MKATLFVLLTLLSFTASAQTKIIGHKSHSGAAANFSIEAEGNFGLFIERRVSLIQKISDSVVVMTYVKTTKKNKPKEVFRKDTVNFNYDIPSIESLKHQYPNAKFVGFKEQKEKKEIKTGGVIIDPKSSEEEDSYLVYFLGAFSAFIGFWSWKTAKK